MTTKELKQKTTMAVLMAQRQAALDRADADRREAREDAHRTFVAGVRELMHDTDMSVVDAAKKAGLSRGVLHDLIRHYSSSEN